MLNVIWPIFIIISVIYAFLCGNIENVSNGIFSSLNDVIDLSLTLLGTMCLWNGIMEIARNTSFVDRLCKMLNPLIKILFPRLENEKAKRETHTDKSTRVYISRIAGGCCNYRNSCRNFCSGLCSTAGKKQGSNRYGQCPGCLCRSTNCRKFR